MTRRDIIQQATLRFQSAQIASARLDAEVLLAHCLVCQRLDFLKDPDRDVPPDAQAAYESVVARRLSHEPVAYITGRKAFWSFVLEVNPHVLIPRPDTEVLVEETLDICRASGLATPRLIDIGTGSGAIALALAVELPEAVILASDQSAAALDTARRNAIRLHLQDRITFLQGDLFEPTTGLFDVIVSNPPYIGKAEYDTLPDGVRRYEPQDALLAGQSGLEIYEKLVYQAQSRLKPGGWLLLEIGATQHDAVHRILEESGGYTDLACRNDYAGLPRVMKGRRVPLG